ncbi:MAG TPA: FAD-dependent oxidoreductase, partial [Ilumatobacteraceae bacterium]
MTVTNSRTASDPVEDVVVIGAGVAGLTAAYELRAHSPLVLEADDIIGGRVRTVDVEGVPMNLGAEYWVNAPGDPYPRGLLAEIGVELTSRMDDGRGGLVIGGQHIAATSADELADGLGFSAAARDDLVRTSGRVAATIDRLWTSADGAQLGAELMTTSAADWLGTVDPAVRRLYDDLAMITPGSALDHLHALSFIVLIPSIGGTAGHQWGAEVILGGSARLAQALASRGSRPPVLGAHVVDVSAADEVSGPTAGARVRYFRDGELHAVTARHVIVATPASVAAAMCRTLPDWKLGALREVSYAAWSSVDVVAEFDDPVSWASSGTIPFLDGPVSLLLNNGPIGDDRTLAVRLLTGGVRAEPYFDSGIERLQA